MVETELMIILESDSPDIERFKGILVENPHLIDTEQIIEREFNGSLLHNTAKWDTIKNRRGLLTNIVLYEFGADPNCERIESQPVYWGVNQLQSHSCLKAIKLILSHKDLDIHKARGKRGPVEIVLTKEYNNQIVSEYMFKKEAKRKELKSKLEQRKLEKLSLLVYRTKNKVTLL